MLDEEQLVQRVWSKDGGNLPIYCESVEATVQAECILYN